MQSLLKKPLLLSLLGGLLLFVAWPSSPLFPLLFVGMSCLLLAAKELIDTKKPNWKYFGTLYLGLLTWNVASTWWIYYATLGGVLMAVIANAALMTLPFFVFKMAYKAQLHKLALTSFVLAWLGFEYIHHTWSLTWPWLTLGNGLAKFPHIIQWYEYTGTGGGSFWILTLNCLIFSTIQEYKKSKIAYISAIFILPIAVSLLIFFTYPISQNPKTTEVVVVQPNFNTYTQKSYYGTNYIPEDEQIRLMIAQSKTQLTDKTSFLVWPETAINGSNRESYFQETETYSQLKFFLNQYPNLTLVSGFDSYEICKNQQKPTQFASYAESVGFYESYNAALMITKDSFAIYHKSKFVPGAEQVPFPWLIKPIEIILGGVGFGHFFGQEKQIPFTGKDGTKAAPSICYESIFGLHMAEFNQNGAQLLFVLTNDDWWHDTEGHRQHFDYARIRCIETRLPMARSANTGFSGFIDARGVETQKTEYRKEACIKTQLPIENHPLSLYVRFGDYIGKTATYLLPLLLILLLFKRFTLKK